MKQGKSAGLKGQDIDSIENQIEQLSETPTQKKLDNAAKADRLEHFTEFFRLRDTGRYSEAKACLKKALEYDPDNPRSLAHLAHIYLLTGQKDLARKTMEKAFAANPDHPAVLRNAARVFMHFQDPGKAFIHAEKAYHAQPHHPENCLVMSSALYGMNKNKEAMDYIDSALKIKPGYAEALGLKALLLLRRSDLQGAEQHVKKGVAIKPFLDNLWALLSRINKGLGKIKEAVTALEKAVELNPGNADYLISLSELHHLAGDGAKFLSTLEKAVNLCPDNAIAWVNYAVALKQAGMMENALEACDRALNLNNLQSLAYNNKGGILQELGRLDQAMACYNEALQIDHDDPVTYNNIGKVLQKLNKSEQAIEYHKKALDLNPGSAEAQCDLGSAFFNIGNLNDASQHFKQSISVDREYEAAYFNLGLTLSRMGKYYDALPYLQASLEKNPEDAEKLTSLVRALNHCHSIKKENRDLFLKAQLELQNIDLKQYLSTPITDESVKFLYHQAHHILKCYELDEYGCSLTQIYRGVDNKNNCARHKAIFDTYNIIPAYCFECYKIVIEPQTLVDHIKLLLTFSFIKLPKDNERKCAIEVRPEIPGKYKGFIYCLGLEEAKALLPIVQEAVSSRINKGINLKIKRGCSEYPLKYLEYNRFDDNEQPIMSYPEKWRTFENQFDQTWYQGKYPLIVTNHNHCGLTLRDALVMRRWMAYARNIGDASSDT